ncbi:hypothetical protein AVEN_14902-1 [Araneus ventricosus]|uniref:Uncharacterized protein n=1 Tax=Araneus ventricosus TaxID=182803 RepID=A0A4Y2F6T4_ARAVE|nr:hypothetical protein AVEN_14902-1 [Araneus ventricosus]
MMGWSQSSDGGKCIVQKLVKKILFKTGLMKETPSHGRHRTGLPSSLQTEIGRRKRTCLPDLVEVDDTREELKGFCNWATQNVGWFQTINRNARFLQTNLKLEKFDFLARTLKGASYGCRNVLLTMS